MLFNKLHRPSIGADLSALDGWSNIQIKKLKSITAPALFALSTKYLVYP